MPPGREGSSLAGHDLPRPPGDTCVTDVDRIETARMVLERLRASHHDELSVLLLDPRVARTLWPGEGPASEAQLLHILGDKLEHWDRHGFGLWLLRDRASGAVVGRGGLQHTNVGGNAEIEAGWAIVPERWGEGLATELAQACTAVAFEQLELEQIVAFTLPTNVASRRVMEKSGFAYERDVSHKDLVHVLYRAGSRR
jgi:ribosomal-protein-alanine N-acetyltransferase